MCMKPLCDTMQLQRETASDVIAFLIRNCMCDVNLNNCLEPMQSFYTLSYFNRRFRIYSFRSRSGNARTLAVSRCEKRGSYGLEHVTKVQKYRVQ